MYSFTKKKEIVWAMAVAVVVLGGAVYFTIAGDGENRPPDGSAPAPPPRRPRPPRQGVGRDTMDKERERAEIERLRDEKRALWKSLEEIRNTELARDPQLHAAYDCWMINKEWKFMNHVEARPAMDWWHASRDDDGKRAIKVSLRRKLAIAELLATIEDPTTRDWVSALGSDARWNSPDAIKIRRNSWNEVYDSLTEFDRPPPPEVMAELLDPNKRRQMAEFCQISETERQAAPPDVLEYLSGSAQAGVLEASGRAFYDQRKGRAICEAEEQYISKESELLKAIQATKKPN